MCIEVAADDDTRMLLDLGMPLVAPDGGDFPAPHAAAADRGADHEGVLVPSRRFELRAQAADRRTGPVVGRAEESVWQGS
jgi:hypothetical protein